MTDESDRVMKIAQTIGEIHSVYPSNPPEDNYIFYCFLSIRAGISMELARYYWTKYITGAPKVGSGGKRPGAGRKKSK